MLLMTLRSASASAAHVMTYVTFDGVLSFIADGAAAVSFTEATSGAFATVVISEVLVVLMAFQMVTPAATIEPITVAQTPASQPKTCRLASNRRRTR